jgi:hypothetical protein
MVANEGLKSVLPMGWRSLRVCRLSVIAIQIAGRHAKLLIAK